MAVDFARFLSPSVPVQPYSGIAGRAIREAIQLRDARRSNEQHYANLRAQEERLRMALEESKRQAAFDEQMRERAWQAKEAEVQRGLRDQAIQYGLSGLPGIAQYYESEAQQYDTPGATTPHQPPPPAGIPMMPTGPPTGPPPEDRGYQGAVGVTPEGVDFGVSESQSKVAGDALRSAQQIVGAVSKPPPMQIAGIPIDFEAIRARQSTDVVEGLTSFFGADGIAPEMVESIQEAVPHIVRQLGPAEATKEVAKWLISNQKDKRALETQRQKTRRAGLRLGEHGLPEGDPQKRLQWLKEGRFSFQKDVEKAKHDAAFIKKNISDILSDNPTRQMDAVYGIAKARDAGGRLSDKDVDKAMGDRTVWEEAAVWFSHHRPTDPKTSASLPRRIRENLAEALAEGHAIRMETLRRYYDDARVLRDESRDEVEYGAWNTQIKRLFGGLSFASKEREAETEEKRPQKGGKLEEVFK